MMKRKEFMLGAVAGLAFAAAATAGGVIDWPTAEAGPVAGVSGRLAPNAGAGLAFAPPQGAPLSFADIFAQVAPAVVQIEVRTRVQRPSMIQIPGMPFAIPNPNGGQEGEDGEDGGGVTAVGAGSGFFISADGFIATNNHVVADATEIRVKLADGREMTARLVGRDEATDLAVIKVDGTDFPFVNFEETAQPRVGDWVIAVGNPFGLGGTATAGIVSAVGRQDVPDSTSQYVDFLQIDAAINRGNSGGPTFDIYGRVIGVNSAIYSETGGGSVGIGFAIPASVAKSITDQLMSGEGVERGYVGVTIAPVDADIATALGLPNAQGALVVDYTPDAPANRAGLRFGDVVTRIDGQPVATSTELTRRIATIRPGDRARLTVVRDGRESVVTVSPTRRPGEAELFAAQGKASLDRTVLRGLRSQGESILGLSLANTSETLRTSGEIADRYRGPVVIAVAPSAASDAGVGPGMLILAVNGMPVSSVSEVRSAVSAARGANRKKVLLLVGTARGPAPLVVELTAD